jgi:uncharacterized protein (TIGR00369 family)
MNNARIDELLTLFHQNARLARTFGLTLSFNAEGQATVDMPYNPALDHGLGGIHGGVYMTLIDTAAWFTAAAAHDNSIWVATSELTVHLLKPAARTALRCVGRLVRSGKRQDIVEAHLYDADERLVGHGIGTFVVLPHISTDDPAR